MKTTFQNVGYVTLLLAWASVSFADQPAPLSVAPLEHVQYPDDRPKWIEASPTDSDDKKSDDDVTHLVVHSGVCASKAEVEEMLRLMGDAAIDDVMQRLLDESEAVTIDRKVQVDQNWIDEKVVSKRYVGPVHRGGEIAYEGAIQFRIDKKCRDYLEAKIADHRTGERLGVVGLFALLGFGGFVSGSIVLGGLSARRR